MDMAIFFFISIGEGSVLSDREQKEERKATANVINQLGQYTKMRKETTHHTNRKSLIFLHISPFLILRWRLLSAEEQRMNRR